MGPDTVTRPQGPDTTDDTTVVETTRDRPGPGTRGAALEAGRQVEATTRGGFSPVVAAVLVAVAAFGVVVWSPFTPAAPVASVASADEVAALQGEKEFTRTAAATVDLPDADVVLQEEKTVLATRRHTTSTVPTNVDADLDLAADKAAMNSRSATASSPPTNVTADADLAAEKAAAADRAGASFEPLTAEDEKRLLVARRR